MLILKNNIFSRATFHTHKLILKPSNSFPRCSHGEMCFLVHNSFFLFSLHALHRLLIHPHTTHTNLFPSLPLTLKALPIHTHLQPSISPYTLPTRTYSPDFHSPTHSTHTPIAQPSNYSTQATLSMHT